MTTSAPVVVGNNDVIPYDSDKKPRTLVLCFDGTGDQFDADNANVVQFFSLLQKDDHTQQMVYYQSGIGTYTVPQISNPIMSKFSKIMDLAIAWNLDAHVMDGYYFLMENYQVGDKICLFGFSRGAYTARALAGMVHKVGLLPAGNTRQVPFAYRMYMQATPDGWTQSDAFKKAFSIDVDVEFVGVWDTVCSVGIFPKRRPFVSNNNAIRFFRHAISLDERRAKFKANHYNRPTRDEEKLGVLLGEMPKSTGTRSAMAQFLRQRKSRTDEQEAHDKDEQEHESNHQHNMDTNVLEVWFAGCHCDVGGGSVKNETRYNLARIPLRWMIRQCFLADTGIRFHSSLLSGVGIDHSTLYPVVKPRPDPIFEPPVVSTSLDDSIEKGHERSATDISIETLVDPESAPIDDPFISEEVEDLLDSRAKKYDRLTITKGWWVLEYLPLKQRYQKPDTKWVEKTRMNRAKPRVVPQPTKDLPFNVHRTVQIRQAANDLFDGKYTPKVKMPLATYVD